MTAPAEAEVPPEPEPEPEWDWQPVAGWPVDMREIVEDLEQIEHVIALMRGAAISGDSAYPAAKSFLERAQQARRSELAARILAIHGMDAALGEEAPQERRL